MRRALPWVVAGSGFLLLVLLLNSGSFPGGEALRGIDPLAGGEALLEAGIAAYNRGDFVEAERLLASCARRRAISSQWDEAFRCRRTYAQTLFNLGRLLEEEKLLLETLQSASWLDQRRPEIGEVHAALAELYLNTSRFPQAEEAALRSLEPLRKSAAPDAQRALASTLFILGQVRRTQARLPESEEALREALTLYERIEGPQGGNVAAVATELGVTKERLGDQEDGRRLLVRALDIYDAERDGGHPFGGMTLVDLAILDRRRDAGTLAKDELLQACERLERDFGPSSPRLAWALEILGASLLEEGRLTEAESVLRRSLSIYEAGGPPLEIEARRTVNLLANVLWKLERYEEALPLAQRSLAASEVTEQTLPADLATSEVFLGMLHGKLGDMEQAERHLRKGLELRERLSNSTSPEVARVIEELTSILRARGKEQEARMLEERLDSVRRPLP